jgi:hypothetical protein
MIEYNFPVLVLGLGWTMHRRRHSVGAAQGTVSRQNVEYVRPQTYTRSQASSLKPIGRPMIVAKVLSNE